MKPWRLLSGLMLAACAAAPSGSGGAATAREGGNVALSARLEIAETLPAGAPATLRFTLENRGQVAVSVLLWNTPFEGLRGAPFDVARDGEPVPFAGPMIKRGDPDAAAYRRIEPGGSIAAEVDLGDGYDVAPPGTYRVAWNGWLHDVVRAGTPVPRPRDAHEGMEVASEPVAFRRVP